MHEEKTTHAIHFIMKHENGGESTFVLTALGVGKKNLADVNHDRLRENLVEQANVMATELRHFHPAD